MRVQAQSFLFSIRKKIMRLKGLNTCHWRLTVDNHYPISFPCTTTRAHLIMRVL